MSELTREQIEQLSVRLIAMMQECCNMQSAKDEWQRQIQTMRDMALRALPDAQPVAWGIIACNTGKLSSVTLDKSEADEYKPEHRVPLYTRPDDGLVEMVPIEREHLIEWHKTLAGCCEQTDDFAGARMHSDRARALGGKR